MVQPSDQISAGAPYPRGPLSMISGAMYCNVPRQDKKDCQVLCSSFFNKENKHTTKQYKKCQILPQCRTASCDRDGRPEDGIFKSKTATAREKKAGRKTTSWGKNTVLYWKVEV